MNKKSATVKNTTGKKKKKRLKKEKKSLFSGVALYQYLFVSLLLIGGFLCVLNFATLQDISNEFIENERNWLLPLQYFVYTFLFAAVVYFGVRAFSTQKLFSSREKVIALAVFGIFVILYAMVLHKGISNNGDNASFIINAKSLVEKGGFYRLHMPGEPKDALGAIGLPLVLSPIYAIWGIDTFKMKIAILLMGLFCFPLLYTLFKELKQNDYIAIILAIVIGSHPILLSSSTAIMTEIPFVFWSLASVVAVLKYAHASRVHFGYLILAFFSMAMLYFTRAIGIGIFPAASLFLLFRVPFRKYFKEGNFSAISKNLEFKKFIILVGPLVIGLLAYIIFSLSKSRSQFQVAFHSDMSDNFRKSQLLTWWILSQLVDYDNTMRWISFVNDVQYEKLNFKWVGINVLILLGFVKSIWKREIIGFFILFTVLLLFLFNPDTRSLMVMARYLSVFIPFIIYFLFEGIIWLFQLLYSQIKKEQLRLTGKLIAITGISFILFSNYSADGFVIAQANDGQQNKNPMAAFIQAAEWCKENLPPDALVASRKPRLFYIFSNLKGVGTTDYGEEYSKENEIEKIREFKAKGVTHLILDRFSSSSKENIVPLLTNNPQVFQLLHTIKLEGPGGTCNIVTVKYDSLEENNDIPEPQQE